MSEIKGKIKEQKEFTKQCGIFEGEVVAINPSPEQFKDVLGITLNDDSKAAEYLGESKDGNQYVRINVWFRNVKTQEIFPTSASFFLENRQKDNKDEDKWQYINSVGTTTWLSKEEDVAKLPEWFTTREYRIAYVGEEELYNFLRTWLGKLDYRDAETVLQLDWKKLMKGNVKDISDQIGGEYACNIGPLATIVTREKDGETKEYQGIYNRAFLPAYAIKHFRLVDYSDKDVLSRIAAKKPRDQKAHEKFALSVSGEHGCRDYFILKDLQDYSSEMNIVASEKVISPSGSDY